MEGPSILKYIASTPGEQGLNLFGTTPSMILREAVRAGSGHPSVFNRILLGDCTSAGATKGFRFV